MVMKTSLATAENRTESSLETRYRRSRQPHYWVHAQTHEHILSGTLGPLHTTVKLWTHPQGLPSAEWVKKNVAYVHTIISISYLKIQFYHFHFHEYNEGHNVECKTVTERQITHIIRIFKAILLTLGIALDSGAMSKYQIFHFMKIECCSIYVDSLHFLLSTFCCSQCLPPLPLG